jgi:hypothetical protein
VSLLWDANGDRIDTPTFSPPAEMTLIVAWRSASDTLRQTLLNHTGVDLQLGWRANSVNKEHEFYHQGATYGVAVADIRNYTAYGLNKQLYTIARSGAAGCSLWLGDDDRTPAAPSGYLSQVTVATPVTTTGTGRIGSDNSAIRYNDGPIGLIALWSVVMSDADADKFWRNPSRHFLRERQVFYLRPGSNGVTDVPDESGNGLHGTITGLSAPDLLPTRVFRSPQALTVAARLRPAAFSPGHGR